MSSVSVSYIAIVNGISDQYMSNFETNCVPYNAACFQFISVPASIIWSPDSASLIVSSMSNTYFLTYQFPFTNIMDTIFSSADFLCCYPGSLNGMNNMPL